MAGIRNLRNAVREVPDVIDSARVSLENLDGGIKRANGTMLILAAVAVLALGVATVALLRAEAVGRAR